MTALVDNPKNISGLGFMMSDDNSSLEQLEREIIGTGTEFIENEQKNIVNEYKVNLEKLRKNLSLSGMTGDTSIMSKGIKEKNDSSNFGSNSGSNSGLNYGFGDSFGDSSNNDNAQIDDDTDDEEDEMPNFENDDAFINSSSRPSSAMPNMGHQIHNPNMNANSYGGSEGWSRRRPDDKQLNMMTAEAKNQSYIKGVMNELNYGGSTNSEFNIDREREDDEKNSLLNDIDELRTILKDEDIDVKNVPIVTRANSMSEIQDVYKILIMKNERNRNRYIGEEFILLGANILEMIFDGKREIVGHKLDLTGWSEKIKPKLPRMRYETSTLVKDIMQTYGIGGGWTRIFIELAPSLWNHSKSRRSIVNNNDTLADDYDYKEAVNRLNSTNF